jgi:hypothetical protein
MGRYVYKQLTWVDVAILAVFVAGPVFFVFQNFIFASLATLFVAAYLALWGAVFLFWFAVGAWWIARRFFP